MAVVPVVPSINTGIPSSSTLAALAAAISYALSPPVFRGRANATQSITASTWTSLNLGIEDVDTDPSGAGGHSTSVNTSRFVAVYAGWYAVGGGAHFAANVTGRRGMRFAVNGVLVEASGSFVQATSASATTVPGTMELVFLNVGDYVEVQAFQESGGALNTGNTGSNEGNSRLDVKWVSN